VVRSLVFKKVRIEIRGLMMDLNSFIKFERALFSKAEGGFVGVLSEVSPITFAYDLSIWGRVIDC